MEKQLRHIDKTGVKEIPVTTNMSKLRASDTYWLEIRSDDRNAVVEYLTTLEIKKRVLKHVSQPGISSRTHVIANVLVLNVPVSNPQEIFTVDYLTIIAQKNLLITIISQRNTILNDIEQEIDDNLGDFAINLYLIIYFITSELLQAGIENASHLRKKINALAEILKTSSDKQLIREITKNQKDVGIITAVVEDQFHVLGFIPMLERIRAKDIEQIWIEMKELSRGFEYLQNNLERQGEKLDAMYLQFQLILQEKGNKRLNTLTIIQAIFVPLTLITGIYGMNFSNMPELKWSFSYFLVIGLMIIIALLILQYFRKNGWFD